MARKTAKQRKKEKKIALVLVAVLALAALTAAMLASPAFAQWLFRVTGIVQSDGPPAAAKQAAVSVHVIDVGQGDAVLLCADGEYALIDAGPPEAAGVLVSYLRQAGATHLRYLFMTHPHNDHYGGMEEVLQAVEVEQLVISDMSLAPLPTAITFESLLAAALEKGVHTTQTKQGDVHPLGSGSITVVHGGLATTDNYNLLSLGLLFDAGGLRLLNTGDGEKENENAMQESGLDIAADIFVAGHHGSNTSNGEEFIGAVAPQIVAISCAAGNSYGHPHRSALAAYEAAGARVLRTDKDGTIVVWLAEDGSLQHAVAKNRNT
ncbi:MBL fold metallo-hydrolase [Clostridia bacterium OttesenSCG-928-O13]|nr:MBL fold metallo-hydrolase [Clostridia bacterium OttesenSCG-928-O13]